MRRKPVILCATIALMSTPVALTQEKAEDDSFTDEANDAWLTGKVEMAYTLNRHLNPFSIDSDVDSGVVTLTGEVESEIERDLAGQIAEGIDGITDVRNELDVGMSEGRDSQNMSAESRNFPTWFDDATTTAAVKSRLIGNSNTSGLQIDVDTREDIVTLSGSVESSSQKNLAGEIARNTGDVKDVRNLLVIDDS